MKRYRWKYVFAAAALLVLIVGCGSKSGSEAENSAEAEETEAPSDTVRLSEESLSQVEIAMVPVARGNLNMTLRTPGRISFNLNRTAKVTSTFEGRIRQMNYDVGAQVRPGDVMALVESPELINRPLELKAPVGGQVIERHGTVGEAVDRARELYTISDLSEVWAIAEIKEKDIAAVRVGDSATVRVTAYPREVFAGKIALIGNEVEEKTRTVEARIKVDNRDGKLKPGMFADVEIVMQVLKDVLIVPDDALQTLDDQQIVFVATSPNTFAKRIVKVGLEQNGQAEILDGIQEGEQVVTKGSFLLKSELLKGELGEE